MLFRFGGAFSTYTNCNCILEADPNTGSGSIWLGDYTAAIDLVFYVFKIIPKEPSKQ